MHNSRKPERTIHIAPSGSASLVKSSKKIQSIPKELHHCIQHVRTSLNNLSQEIELHVNSKKDLKINNEGTCDASGGEDGLLAIRTCKSREDKLPPIGTDIHVVDILNPKTPQKLYYVNMFNDSQVSSEHDSTDSSSSSSSEGFLPPNQSASTQPLRHLVDHHYTKNVNVQNEIDEPLDTVRSRSCSPPVVKVSGQQQRPLKEFSVKVIKLPQSIITSSRNTSVHTSEHTNEIHEDGNLISNERGESNRTTSNVENEISIVEPTTATSRNELLCEESIEFGAVSCTEANNGISEIVQDDLDQSTVDCNDHLQDVVEAADNGNSKEMHMASSERNCEAVSLPGSKNEDDDELAHKESKEKVQTDSDTECEGNVESDKPDQPITVTISNKDNIKKHSKKIKSEKYVVSSSENETNVDTEKSTGKRSKRSHKNGFQNITITKNKSNKHTALSGSDHEEISRDFLPHKGIKPEKVAESPQSNSCTIISSSSEHEETEMHERKKFVEVQRPASAASTAKQISPSSSGHSVTPKRSHETHNLVSHTKEIAEEKPTSVKRKLNMTEEVVTEGMDAKRHAPKYKLRSKGNS